MKKTLTGLLILLTFGLISCDKETSEENGGVISANGDFRASIDGNLWIANTNIYAIRENGTITIHGANTDRKSMTISVADSGIHSYRLSNTSLTNIGVFEDSLVIPIAAWTTNQWFVDGIYGDLNITRIDTVAKRMSGTFNMNVVRTLDGMTRTITSGVFNNIPYTGSYVPPPPPPPLEDTLDVNIDGVSFDHTSLSAIASGPALFISASDAGGFPDLGIIFSSAITPGTYSFNADAQAQYTEDGIDFLDSQSGTLIILEHNTTTRRIRGTFEFTANDGAPPDVIFTGGYFALTY